MFAWLKRKPLQSVESVEKQLPIPEGDYPVEITTLTIRGKSAFLKGVILDGPFKDDSFVTYLPTMSMFVSKEHYDALAAQTIAPGETVETV